MPLIPSHRHSDADLREWERLEAFDEVLARSPSLARKEERALEVLRAFAAEGPCYVGTSWGKDSVPLAHMVARLKEEGLDLPLVHVRSVPNENPDCVAVRDEFLRRFPSVRYVEIEKPAEFDGEWWDVRNVHQQGFAEAAERFGDRYVSGVRAAESGVRRMAVRRHGEASKHSCRPIARWTGADVFAYAYRHDLPVHPAYAMSQGGMIDREWLRVAALGGERGAIRGRREWERHYYGDVLEALESAQ